MVLIFVMLSSCTDPTQVVERWPNGKPKETRYYDNPDDTAQYYVTRYYENGVKQEEGLIIHEEKKLKIGGWKSWYDNGNLRSEMYYRDGIPFDQYTLYHPNGIVKETGSYNIDGKLNGEWMQFDSFNGERRISGNYYKGAKADHWTYYAVNSRTIDSIFNYDGSLKTVLDSTGMTQFDSGQKKVRIQEDQWTYFHPNGKISAEFIRTSSGKITATYWDTSGKQLAVKEKERPEFNFRNGYTIP